jgi:hypothetical protein
MRCGFLWVGLMVVGVAGAQQAAPDREALKKVTPNISGQRDGVYLEPDAVNFDEHAGYVALFDGKTLKGWDGRPGVWSVVDGAMVGVSTVEKNAGNSNIVYRGVEAKDFDLKLEMKVERGGGSGIQYRSKTGIPPGETAAKGEPALDPRWVMIGPQMDFWKADKPRTSQFWDYSGQLYSENTARGIVAWRGEAVESEAGKFPRLMGKIGERGRLGAAIKYDEWNQVMIVARGGVVMHFMNGQLMAVLVDDDPKSPENASGLIGLQIEGLPARVAFRNIWLRKID